MEKVLHRWKFARGEGDLSVPRNDLDLKPEEAEL